MADTDDTPTLARARMFPAAVFWLLVIGSLVLLAGHFLVGLSASVADGAFGAQARSGALAGCARTAALPLVVVLGLLAAVRRTRTREHLALGAFLTLALGVAILWPRAAADLERARPPAPPQDDLVTALDDLAAGCRDGCPPEVDAAACARFCDCFVDQVRRAEPESAWKLLAEPEDPESQQELERLAMLCPAPNDPPATTP